MSIFRCKMCGGSLEIEEGNSYGTCEFCGTQQTVPTVKDENVKNLFNRANVLRMKSEFDKAADLYEKIIHSNESEAEAYWGLILCKYGIEYVEDPVTFERIPTCHRASYDAVTTDEDYKNAIKHADMIQRGIYEKQAKAIDEIQKGILTLAQQEQPYDVFICYKETDENGQRTQDSVIANDIYHQLTQEGFKVFYAAISLEDKLGKEYEPYIFSALNTAKVMLSLGTKPEYFNAVWVKNEWSRFLKIMKKDRSKLLIPCYRDMDPYELPEEFAHLQAQDMSKIGFINDIVRGIKKVITKDSPKMQSQETVVVQQGSYGTTTNAQVKRGNMALEDHDWDKADSFFEEALNLDPECAEAYLGKLLAKRRQSNWIALLNILKNEYADRTTERLEACPSDQVHINKMAKEYALSGYLEADTICKLYDYDRGYDSALSCRKSQKSKQLREIASEKLLIRAQQYARADTQKQIENGIADITAVLDQRIAKAEEENKASIERVKKAYESHIAVSDKKAKELNEDAKNRQEQQYQAAVSKMNSAKDIRSFEGARDALKAMKGYKDSSELAAKCQKEIDRLNEEKRQEEERQAAIRKKEAERAAKKRKKTIGIVSAVAAICVVAVLVVTQVIIPKQNYNSVVTKYGQEKVNEIASLNVGDSYTFGRYEQDNNTGNGAEDIEWTVVDKTSDGCGVMLVSKYALDTIPYNNTNDSVTWETCTLRNWLNSTFIDSAFTTEEQDLIGTTNVTADSNPKHSTSAGNLTQDQVYLLSITEAEKYFNSDDDRMCVPTAFAVAKGAYTSNEYSVGGKATCWWWLRSPGSYSSSAAPVYDDGSVHYDGDYVDYGRDCVRPALWINLQP